ncbi:hypothetical protein PoB_004684500 [Plakobranchus ocellatus]|uniref:Uncharacterized protein n=1 Tax=Plakobranchus ocellatus TaxID=259542 RepID=A0AAV4BMS2_9GAST|nr:hypothetical protein PoB_004684500 [Plakobranchus ocellatus]
MILVTNRLGYDLVQRNRLCIIDNPLEVIRGVSCPRRHRASVRNRLPTRQKGSCSFQYGVTNRRATNNALEVKAQSDKPLNQTLPKAQWSLKEQLSEFDA